MSTLKVNNLQVGQDSTPTNNLTWFQPGSPDGTIRLGSGNAGSATSKFTFDKDGNLTCAGTITATSIEGTLDDWIIHQGDADTKYGFPTNDTFTIETAGSERLRVTSAGKVGINEDVPQGTIHVAGTGNYSDVYLSNSTSGHTGSDGANIFLNNNLELGIWNKENGHIRFATNGNERLRINSDGNISNDNKNASDYGNTNLLISGDSSATNLTLMCDAANPQDYASLAFRVAGGTTGDYTKAGIFAVRNTSYNALDMVFGFNTAADNTRVTTAHEKLRISHTGDVFINRNSGLSNAKVSIQCDAAEAAVGIQANGSAGETNLLQVYNSAGPNTSIISQVNTTATPALLFKIYDGSSSTNEKVRIDDDGLIVKGNSKLAAINITSGKESPYDEAGTGETIFVYDTRNDADGGAWRKKCRHTSWYNETSGTYRGTRKEFPAVAIIVLGQVRTTIYDADDPTMPLWMQFRSGSAGYLLAPNDDRPSCVTALNGVIYIGSKNVYGGFHMIDFIKDEAKRIRASVTSNGTHGYWPTGIAGRNGTDDAGGLWIDTGRGYDSTDFGGLKTDDVWSVAVKVLKGAPIDPITNLPIPTIAVGLDGGISIIKPEWHLGLNRSNTPSYLHNDVSGHIVDIISSDSNKTLGRSVEWTDNDDLIFVMGDGNGDFDYIQTMDGHIKWDNSITIDTKTANNNHHVRSMWRGRYSGSTVYSNLLSTGSDWSTTWNTHQHKVNQVTAKKGYEFAARTRGGLNHIYENPEGDNSMIAYTTKSHTTGWMVGKEKMCVMASTDTTNLSGTDLAPNNCATTGPGRTEANATTGWTNGGMATFASSNTRAFEGSYSLHLTANTNGDYCYFTFPTTVGKKYTVSARLWVTHDSFTIKCGTAAGSGNEYFESPAIGTVAQWQMFTGSFQATATTSYFNVTESSTSQDSDGYIDNVIVTEADPDHTNTHGYAGAGALNQGVNRGLQVYGTVTKSAVATGSELVAYSGWSASNYLYQAYNPNLNHGSGDFAFYWWMNPNDSSGGKAIWSIADNKTMTASNASSYIRVYFNGDDLRYDLSTAGQSYDTGQKTLRMHPQDMKSWMLCHLIRRGNYMEIWINGKRELVKVMQTFLWGQSLFSAYSELRIGHDTSSGNPDNEIQMALFRSSRSAPNEHQIKKMYKDELGLFQENAKCTLVGTTNDHIEAMSYDKRSDILYVGGKGGRADFSGLVRINNNTTEVTRGMSASNDLVVEY